MSKQAIIKLKMMVSVTLKARMRTNSFVVTLGSPEYSSSPPSVTAVFHLSSTMACCVFVRVCEQARYKSKAKDLLKSGCNELLRPDILTALYQSTMGSKVNSHRVVNHGNSDPCPQTCRKEALCSFKTYRHRGKSPGHFLPPCCFWTRSHYITYSFLPSIQPTLTPTGVLTFLHSALVFHDLILHHLFTSLHDPLNPEPLTHLKMQCSSCNRQTFLQSQMQQIAALQTEASAVTADIIYLCIPVI